MPSLGRVYGSLFRIPPEETTCARRGFQGGERGVRLRLEQVGQSFLEGYHAALQTAGLKRLSARLDCVNFEFRGFAFEGAAMALALLDHVTPWKKNRWGEFLRGPGGPHTYMVHVGAGWALARLPWVRRRLQSRLARLDPLLRWLTIDGYGFHEGYFCWPRYLREKATPQGLFGYSLRVFDQGLGRSLWFVHVADPGKIFETISTLPAFRHADLWSGVGLACAYAGGADSDALRSLRVMAGPHLPQLAQGAAFAAKARERAGIPAEWTEMSCHILCNMTAPAAAEVTDLALVDLPTGGEEPAYEVWRRRIHSHLAREPVRA